MSKNYFKGVLCERCVNYRGRFGDISDRTVICKDKTSLIHVNDCKDFRKIEGVENEKHYTR